MVGRGIDLCIWIVGIFFGRVKFARRLFPLKAQENPNCQIEIAVQIFLGLKKLLAIELRINAVKQDQILLNVLLAVRCVGGIHFHIIKEKASLKKM